MAKQYRVYGHCLESDMPLHLPEIPAMSFKVPDIVFRLDVSGGSTAPVVVRRIQHEGLTLDETSEGYRMGIEKVGEFLVSQDGREVTCHPWNESLIEPYFLGIVLSFVLRCQSVFAFHASAVVHQDQAIAFFGIASGVGKSTLTAHFLAQGASLLTDDTLCVSATDEHPQAVPGTPTMKLSSESIQSIFGVTPSRALLAWPRSDKRHVSLFEDPRWGSYRSYSVPLRAIYLLGKSQAGAGIQISSVSGQEKLVYLLAHIRARFLDIDVPVQRSILNWLSVIGVRVPMRSITYPRDYDALPQVHAAIIRDLGNLGQESIIDSIPGDVRS